MLVFTISFGIIFSLVIHGHSLFATQTNFYQLSREEKIAHNFNVILNVASAAEFKEIVKIYFSFPDQIWKGISETSEITWLDYVANNVKYWGSALTFLFSWDRFLYYFGDRESNIPLAQWMLVDLQWPNERFDQILDFISFMVKINAILFGLCCGLLVWYKTKDHNFSTSNYYFPTENYANFNAITFHEGFKNILTSPRPEKFDVMEILVNIYISMYGTPDLLQMIII